MLLSLRIAWRYLRAPKSHNAVNVITLMALLGIAVASAAMVCVLSVFNGFTDLANSRLSVMEPQLEVTPARGKAFAADTLAARLTALPSVAKAVPVVREQGLAVMGDRQTPVELWGVTDDWPEVADIEAVTVDGQHLVAADLPWATLSAGAAVALAARPDPYSQLQLYVPKRLGRINPAMPMGAFRADTLGVSAVYQTMQQELDRPVAIMPIGRLQEMLGYDAAEASALAVKLVPGADEAELRRAAGPDVVVRNTLEQHADSLRMISVEKWVTFFMLALIVAIASFNIVSTLVMLIVEKRHSARLLRALGATPRQINRIYVLEGWLVSLGGALIGIVVGVVITLVQQYGQVIKLAGDPSQLSVTAYPARLALLDLPAVLAVTLAAGLLTGLLTLPLRK